MGKDRPFIWIGNHPATDLCNTEPVIDGERVELLGDAGDVVAWTGLAGITEVRDAGGFSRREGARTLAFTRRLRRALREVLETPPEGTLEVRTLNDLLEGEPGVLHVSAPLGPVSWRAPTAARQLRLDLAGACVDILRHDRRLVRRCANPDCVLLYLDVSRNHRRRWCDMATCGNRAKVAAHYARTRGSSPS